MVETAFRMMRNFWHNTWNIVYVWASEPNLLCGLTSVKINALFYWGCQLSWNVSFCWKVCCCEAGVWIWDWSTLKGSARFGVGGVTGMELPALVAIGPIVSATLIGLSGQYMLQLQCHRRCCKHIFHIYWVHICRLQIKVEIFLFCLISQSFEVEQ